MLNDHGLAPTLNTVTTVKKLLSQHCITIKLIFYIFNMHICPLTVVLLHVASLNIFFSFDLSRKVVVITWTCSGWASSWPSAPSWVCRGT